MRVLIACEFSGIVRDAFIARGHAAYSCDLLPSERPGFDAIGQPLHMQGDVLAALDRPWDLMIAHPPCRYLANSGVKHLYIGGRKENGIDLERWELMRKAADFFNRLINAPIKRICIENPIMHGHARRLVLKGYDQIIQPWQFGHGETKATCLWLQALPILKSTDRVEGRTPRVHHASPGPERWKERSRTLPGIAAAMAGQWGSLEMIRHDKRVKVQA